MYRRGTTDWRHLAPIRRMIKQMRGNEGGRRNGRYFINQTRTQDE